MDLFNKKKIKLLEKDLALFRETLLTLQNAVIEIKRTPRCYEKYEELPDGSYLRDFMLLLKAIKEYLGLEIQKTYEDDPQYLAPEVPKIRVIKVVKKETK